MAGVLENAALITLDPNEVDEGQRIGFLHEDKAAAIGRLMAVDGQRDPIKIVVNGKKGGKPWRLVTGMHRLIGARIEGIAVIAIEVSGKPEALADLEASENLHRRPLGPIERAKFTAALVLAAQERIARQHGGLKQHQIAVKARWARVKSGEIRVEQALKDETEDTCAKIAHVYGWEESVGEALGMSRRTIHNDLSLFRLLIEPFPDLIEALAKHPIVGENASQLKLIADVKDEAARRGVIEALIADGDLSADMARASAGLGSDTGTAPAGPAHQKFYNQITGGWNRLGLTQKRDFLPQIAAMVNTPDLKRRLRDQLNEELGATAPDALPASSLPALTTAFNLLIKFSDGEPVEDEEIADALDQAQRALADANKTIGEANSKQFVFGGGAGGGFSISRERPIEGQVASQYQAGVINGSQAVDSINRLRARGKITDETAAGLAAAIANAEVEANNLKEFDKAYEALNSRTLGKDFLKTKTKKPKKDNSAAIADRLREFSEDTGTRIANITDQFSELPTAVTRANKAVRDLDDILSDIEHRKGLSPDAVAKFRQQIEQAKGAIENSLTKPFNDYLDKSREAAEVDRLLLAGRDDEAAALRVVIGLKDKMRPLDEGQLETVLATVEAENRRALVLRDQRALIQTNVRAVQDMRSALEQTVADALSFRRLSIDHVLSSLGNSYIQIMSQRIVERLFGNTLRALERQATGADKVEVSGSRISAAMDDASKSVTRLTASLSAAADRLNLLGTKDETSVAANLGVTDLQAASANAIARYGNSAANDNAAAGSTGGEIVVVGRKPRSPVLAGEGGGLLVDMIRGILADLGIKIPDVIGAAMKVSLARLEKALPSVLSGAFVGVNSSRILLGDRGTGGTIGSAIGGAIGGKLGEKFLSTGLNTIAKGLGSIAGPLGSALGGVLGGLLGGVFKSTTKGYAVVSNTGVSSGGNNSELVQQAASSGSGIQSTVNQIAQQLGASVGSYSVSIGKRSSGWISVSASGSSQVADKSWKKANSGGDLIYDGKDEAAAIAVAISNAIADGAIAGISPKVKQALLSSTDIDQAVREAVKVQDLELALGGISAALEKEFRTFQQTSAERVTLAKKYGFDLVKVEELNNKERLALSQKLLKDQVGSLQDLIDQMTSGSLFEGSAVDQRNALLAKINATQADANAGVEGAADKLANLYQQLNSVSKDVYGTTGGFAADRAAIIDGAQQAIAAANARVVAADKATDPALQTTNSLLDEQAGQLSKIAALMGLTVDQLKALNDNADKTDLSWLRGLAAY